MIIFVQSVLENRTIFQHFTSGSSAEVLIPAKSHSVEMLHSRCMCYDPGRRSPHDPRRSEGKNDAACAVHWRSAPRSFLKDPAGRDGVVQCDVALVELARRASAWEEACEGSADEMQAQGAAAAAEKREERLSRLSGAGTLAAEDGDSSSDNDSVRHLPLAITFL